MRKKNEKRVEMTWVEMDLTKLNLADDSVSVVLDKVNFKCFVSSLIIISVSDLKLIEFD